MYYGFKDGISVYHEMILKGKRAVIPEAQRAQMLATVYKGHQGTMKIQQCS